MLVPWLGLVEASHGILLEGLVTEFGSQCFEPREGSQALGFISGGNRGFDC